MSDAKYTISPDGGWDGIKKEQKALAEERRILDQEQELIDAERSMLKVEAEMLREDSRKGGRGGRGRGRGGRPRFYLTPFRCNVLSVVVFLTLSYTAVMMIDSDIASAAGGLTCALFAMASLLVPIWLQFRRNELREAARSKTHRIAVDDKTEELLGEKWGIRRPGRAELWSIDFHYEVVVRAERALRQEAVAYKTAKAEAKAAAERKSDD